MKSRDFIIILFILFTFQTFSQENSTPVSVLFYNVENLFDTADNPQTDDDEFTPAGDRHWTNSRLNNKLLHTSKVILSAAGWNAPTLVALCEIENRGLLNRLVSTTPLKGQSYKIIHKESPDHRGIDVALLYNPKQFSPITYRCYPLKNRDNSVMKTREILYVFGIINGSDTLHLFVNHWPSRYSGLMETRGDRAAAAKLLREKADNLFDRYRSPKIIILGDFNDQPTDESLTTFLRAEKVGGKITDSTLYNLSYNWPKPESGTLKYRSQWSVFDQIIVSGTLLNCKNGLKTKPENASIIRPEFLLEEDEKYGGLKPKRTYYGYSYLGGFSDHLPVLLKLENGN